MKRRRRRLRSLLVRVFGCRHVGSWLAGFRAGVGMHRPLTEEVAALRLQNAGLRVRLAPFDSVDVEPDGVLRLPRLTEAEAAEVRVWWASLPPFGLGGPRVF